MFFSEMTTKDALKKTKQRMSAYQDELIERLNAIEVDAHWFRRAFHTFAASFLVYYLLPDEEWITVTKMAFPILIVVWMTYVEYQRIRGGVDHQRFFGLRSYERKRPASYLYFGVAVLLLFFFFPQQIAVPCILCACFTDPLIGESRHYLKKTHAYGLGFFVSFAFFLIAWYQADLWVRILIGGVGAAGALIGEGKKLPFLDDDFMIQMLPAVLVLIFWQGLLLIQVDILPPPLLFPL
jgi:dolichol kinase